jgi:hypothetical protein
MTPLALLFSSSGILLALTLPVVILQLVALLMLPGLLRPGMNPMDVGRATYAYLAQSFGVLLLSAGGLPIAYALLASVPLTGEMWTGLLLIFAIGGILFLSHDAHAAVIDSASRAVPAAIFFFSWKLIGLIITLLTATSFVVRLIMSNGGGDPQWWVMHIVVLLYGVILSWFTHMPTEVRLFSFRSHSLHHKPAHAAAAKPAVAKKKKK